MTVHVCTTRGCDGATRPSQIVKGWRFCPLCKHLSPAKEAHNGR